MHSLEVHHVSDQVLKRKGVRQKINTSNRKSSLEGVMIHYAKTTEFSL